MKWEPLYRTPVQMDKSNDWSYNMSDTGGGVKRSEYEDDWSRKVQGTVFSVVGPA